MLSQAKNCLKAVLNCFFFFIYSNFTFYFLLVVFEEQLPLYLRISRFSLSSSCKPANYISFLHCILLSQANSHRRTLVPFCFTAVLPEATDLFSILPFFQVVAGMVLSNASQMHTQVAIFPASDNYLLVANCWALRPISPVLILLLDQQPPFVSIFFFISFQQITLWQQIS